MGFASSLSLLLAIALRGGTGNDFFGATFGPSESESSKTGFFIPAPFGGGVAREGGPSPEESESNTAPFCGDAPPVSAGSPTLAGTGTPRRAPVASSESLNDINALLSVVFFAAGLAGGRAGAASSLSQLKNTRTAKLNLSM